MSNIYDLHNKAFAQVSAYVVALEGRRVATIAFKHPRDGAGRLWAYVHWLGEPMVRSYADGYGYDKGSAATSAAARKLTAPEPGAALLESPHRAYWLEEYARRAGWKTADLTPGLLVNETRVDPATGQCDTADSWESAYAIDHECRTWRRFVSALTPDDGHTWRDRLRSAGFDVWQAV